MTPDEMREDYHCRSAFVDYGLKCEPVEGYRGDVAFTLDDVADVVFCEDTGESYGSDLHAVVQLSDGRWAYLNNSCCSCGFSSRGVAWVTDDYGRLIQFGVVDTIRERLPENLDALMASREVSP